MFSFNFPPALSPQHVTRFVYVRRVRRLFFSGRSLAPFSPELRSLSSARDHQPVSPSSPFGESCKWRHGPCFHSHWVRPGGHQLVKSVASARRELPVTRAGQGGRNRACDGGDETAGPVCRKRQRVAVYLTVWSQQLVHITHKLGLGSGVNAC